MMRPIAFALSAVPALTIGSIHALRTVSHASQPFAVEKRSGVERDTGEHMHMVTPYVDQAVRPLVRLPTGIAVGPGGNVFVADAAAGRIVKLSSTGKLLAQWGGPGSGPGQFENINLIALDRRGNIFAADTGNHRIQKLSKTGRPVAQFGTRGSGSGQLDTPLGVSVDIEGAIYVADTFNDRVQKLSPGGQILGVWGASQGWKHPSSIALDRRGLSYVTVPGNHLVQILSTAGQPEATWGPELGLNKPASIAVAPDGDLYVLDRGNDRIQELSPQGKLLASWGHAGSERGAFSFPSHGHLNGIAIDRHGNIFVSDTGNHRVEKFSASGKLLAVW